MGAAVGGGCVGTAVAGTGVLVGAVVLVAGGCVGMAVGDGSFVGVDVLVAGIIVGDGMVVDVAVLVGTGVLVDAGGLLVEVAPGVPVLSASTSVMSAISDREPDAVSLVSSLLGKNIADTNDPRQHSSNSPTAPSMIFLRLVMGTSSFNWLER